MEWCLWVSWGWKKNQITQIEILDLFEMERGKNYVILQLFILLTVFLQGQNESPILC